jgi:hypothetical protein
MTMESTRRFVILQTLVGLNPPLGNTRTTGGVSTEVGATAGVQLAAVLQLVVDPKPVQVWVPAWAAMEEKKSKERQQVIECGFISDLIPWMEVQRSDDAL